MTNFSRRDLMKKTGYGAFAIALAGGLEKSTLAMSSGTNRIRPDGKTFPFFGVDTAGVHFLRNSRFGRAGWYFPAFGKALQELHVDYIVDHYFELQPATPGVDNKRLTMQMLQDLVKFLKKHEIKYTWSLEKSNWRESFEYEEGKNLYFQNGLQYFRVPVEILEAFKANDCLDNMSFDEIEHMQLTNSKFINRDNTGDRPALADTTGMDFNQAYESIYRKAKELQDVKGQYGIHCQTEFVWPVMHHIFARAGWIVCPKILKESWNPVPFAMTLGAAVQYEKQGADVDFNPDLWFCGHYPGHSVDSLKSTLVACHWLGATKIYAENLDFVNVVNPIHDPVKAKDFDYSKARQGLHHPDAEGIMGSLVTYPNADNVKLTPYGQAVKWYAGEYRFANPRDYTWRDVRCKVAIVRFPDSDWGQKGTFFGDTLLGARNLQSSPATEAWFKIWNLLSKGTIPEAGLSFHVQNIRSAVREGGVGRDSKWGSRFFCPIPPVLVFDHRVGDEHPDFDFRGADILFLTGVTITPATRDLLTRYVQSGKTCISLVDLAPFLIRKQYNEKTGGAQKITDGSGTWILTSDFGDEKVKQIVQPYLPPDDEMQYIFKNKSVVFKMVNNDPHRIEVVAKDM